jgi:hypothetical protein
MNFLKPLLVAALSAGFCVSAFAQQPVANPAELGFAPDRLERITKAFQGWVDDGQIPGAVAGARSLSSIRRKLSSSAM